MAGGSDFMVTAGEDTAQCGVEIVAAGRYYPADIQIVVIPAGDIAHEQSYYRTASSRSISRGRPYLASRSGRVMEPILIWPAPVATASGVSVNAS